MSFIRKNIIALALILIATLFITVGVWRGEVEIIFRKAVNICMECIGIG